MLLVNDVKKFYLSQVVIEVHILFYFRVANQQVMKALRYSYIGRKQKKRIFRRIWISRINAASRLNGLSYSQLIHKLKTSNIDLNRKMLSQIAILDASTFKLLIDIN
jgi:large subunit ribosomal protein L20